MVLRSVVVALAALTACTNSTVSSSKGGLGGEAAGSEQGGAADTSVLDADPTQNQLVLSSKDEELVAIDPANGTAARFFAFDRFVYPRSAAVVGDVLYVGAQDNSVNAISLQTKKLLWDLPLGKYDTSSLSQPIVTVDAGVGYTAGLPGVLTAFDLATGKARWLYPVNPSGELDGIYPNVGRALVGENRVYVGTTDNLFDNTLHAVDKKTGKRIWRKALPHRVTGAMKLAGGMLLVPAGDLFALDATTGDVRWQLAQEPLSRGASTASVAGDAVLVQGAVDVGTKGGKLFCLDLATGTVRWTIEAGNDYAGAWSPLVVGGLVFGVFERGGANLVGNGKPFVADIATGAIVWANDRLSVESDPVYANGRLFFHGQNFDVRPVDAAVGLMSLDAKTGQILWLQNMFRYSRTLSPIVVAQNGVFRRAPATP